MGPLLLLAGLTVICGIIAIIKSDKSLNELDRLDRRIDALGPPLLKLSLIAERVHVLEETSVKKPRKKVAKKATKKATKKVAKK